MSDESIDAEDIFRKYLESENSSDYKRRALNSKSFKNINHSLKDEDINTELATYGDSLLKYALCELLFDECKNITVKNQEYVSDKIFVNVIAKEYELLKHLNYDKDDSRIPSNYEYRRENGKDSPHKYIATAVEALLAAIYLDNKKDLKVLFSVVRKWKELIDYEIQN